ncbi:hypothetical protein PTTG_31089, partial [Puccinia triticina 1-1 BBBD Race 1]
CKTTGLTRLCPHRLARPARRRLHPAQERRARARGCHHLRHLRPRGERVLRRDQEPRRGDQPQGAPRTPRTQPSALGGGVCGPSNKQIRSRERSPRPGLVHLRCRTRLPPSCPATSRTAAATSRTRTRTTTRTRTRRRRTTTSRTAAATRTRTTTRT